MLCKKVPPEAMTIAADLEPSATWFEFFRRSVVGTLSVVPAFFTFFALSDHSKATTAVRVDAAVVAARAWSEEHGNGKLVSVGYCFGGPASLSLGTETRKMADAVGACHPSMLSIPSAIDDVVVPTILCLAEKDWGLGQKDMKALEEALERASSSRGLLTSYNVYVY